MSQRKKEQCVVVCRDISRAFDKVWHGGLKFKILQYNFPNILEKVLCNFIDNRHAKIKIDNHIGPPINLESGVPQGSILSPGLFLMFTNNLPPSGPGCVDVIFADDITQIITHPSKSTNIMGRRVVREIQRVNHYEYLWKIKTNTTKFQLLAISKTKPAEIFINNIKINYNNNIKTLGLSIGRCGINQHIKERVGRGGAALTKIKRFKDVNEKIIIHLYKALVKPIIEYPIIPTCIASRSNVQKLQSIQNRALFMAARVTPPYNVTSQHLHERYNMQPINTILHSRANKIWTKMELINPELVSESIEIGNQDLIDHTWWRRVAPYVASEEPEPIFTQQ